MAQNNRTNKVVQMHPGEKIEIADTTLIFQRFDGEDSIKLVIQAPRDLPIGNVGPSELK